MNSTNPHVYNRRPHGLRVDTGLPQQRPSVPNAHGPAQERYGQYLSHHWPQARPPPQRSSRQDPPRIATPSPDPTSWAAMPPPPLPQQRTCAPGDVHPQPPRSLAAPRVQPAASERSSARPSHGETPGPESWSGVTSNDIERATQRMTNALRHDLRSHCSEHFADIRKQLDQHFAGLRTDVDLIKQVWEQVQICQCQSSVYPAAVESPDPEPDSVARSTSRPIEASPVSKTEDDNKDVAMSDGTPSWAFAASDQVATVTSPPPAVTTPSRTRTHPKKQKDPGQVTKPHPPKYYLRKRKARQRKN
ncbi:hypothetical protein KC328_g13061 [Hortaea werneckii]|nr:hypothetical protein KC328_g13061 [Hortaea werneckii]